MFNKIKNFHYLLDTHSFFTILGMIIIIISLFPFWLLGEYSLIGWYDEVDAHIPWTYLYVNNDYTFNDFVHSFAGGTGIAYGVGGPNISLYRILLEFFDLFYANLIIRLLSLGSLFIGLYFLLINLFNVPKYFAALLALVGLYSTYIPYGWTLGGHGVDISLAVLFALGILGSFNSIKKNILIVFCVSLFSVSISGPVFSIPFVLFFSTFLILFKDKSFFTRTRIQLIIFSFLFLVFLMIINWTFLYYVLVEGKEFSPRIVSNLKEAKEFVPFFIEQFNKNYSAFIGRFDRFSTSIVMYLLVISVVYSIIKRSFKAIALVAFLGIFIPIFLTSFFKALQISGIFEAYRWNVLWNLLGPLSVVAIGSLFSIYKKNDRIHFLIISGFSIVLIYVGISKLVNYSFEYFNKKSDSYKIIDYYNKLSEYDSEYRFISNKYTIPYSLPLYYGLRNYDGIINAPSYRRSYYSLYGINEKKPTRYHPNRVYFIFPHNRNYNDIKLLEMANIKYVISDKKIKGLKLKDVIKGKKISEVPVNKYLKKFIINNYGNIKVLKSLYIHELKDAWPRTFVSNEIKSSKFSLNTKQFYDELKKLEPRALLISKDDFQENIGKYESALDILEEKFHSMGIDITLNNQKGFVVINQVYTPNWKAYCEKEIELNVLPVNGIMMAIDINEECNKLHVVYNKEIKE